MKFVRFVDQTGTTRSGTLESGTITADGVQYDFDNVPILPPVTPTKILASGRNYDSRFSDENEDMPNYPPQPRLFWKGATNTLAGHRDDIMVPATGEVIYGAELGVVIAKRGRNVSADTAEQFIKGYTCTNDISDLTPDPFPSKLRKKSFDGSCPIGPVLATPDEVPTNPRVQLFSNGELKQDSNGDSFVYSVTDLIIELSRMITLEENDIIMMGNPGEMGPMKHGDEIEIVIEGIGTLEHGVIEEGQ